MKTVTIQMGNTDDKLSQREWAAYVLMVKDDILKWCNQVHFFGGPTNYEIWQNVAWVIEIENEKLFQLKARMELDARTFNQDSIAWTEGETQFL